MENRDEILLLDDAALSARCDLEFFKGSGNGGQKRNKTSSAARVRLTGTEFCAEDCTERSQHRNRAAALRKLRLALAYGERRAPGELPRAVCAIDHPEYPFWLARLLDVVAAADWEPKAAAPQLGCSPSAVVKLLARDPALWQFVNQRRSENGLGALHR